MEESHSPEYTRTMTATLRTDLTCFTLSMPFSFSEQADHRRHHHRATSKQERHTPAPPQRTAQANNAHPTFRPAQSINAQ